MTIEEKSAEISGDTDIALEFYNACTITKEKNDNIFKCVTVEGPIPATEDHNGTNFYYYCSARDDSTIKSNSTNTAIKTSVLAWINAQIWKEIKTATNKTELSKV